jgi:hypothetical protein
MKKLIDGCIYYGLIFLIAILIVLLIIQAIE